MCGTSLMYTQFFIEISAKFKVETDDGIGQGRKVRNPDADH